MRDDFTHAVEICCNGVGKTPLFRKRMLAPCCVEPPEKIILRCGKMNDREAVGEFATQISHKRFNRLDTEPRGPCIKTNGKASPAGLHFHRDQRVDHRKRQVINSRQPAILKNLERG